MTIGERLFKLRKEKNISQEELANALDVSRQTISKWENGESTPDFDKIIPLSEYFGITSDELLTGNFNIKEAKIESIKDNYARNLAISISLYILSIVAIIIFAAQFNQPIIGVCLFFILIAVATGLIVYNSIYYKKNNENIKEKTDNSILNPIKNIISILAVIIYLIVSFLTQAWYITWIIFIIDGLIEEIVKLIFNIKGNKGEKNE